MSEYLKMHPQVFFSYPKEPQFFAQEFNNKGAVRSLKAYLALFRKSQPHHKVIAEGSTKYLVSKYAVERINKFNPSAKFLIMLRNPIDMAVSLHEQVLFNGGEDVEDFESAWRARFERAAGRLIPARCEEPFDLQYGEFCKIGEQVERVLSVVPSHRVMFIFYEDFVQNVGMVYSQLLSFLDITPFIPNRFDVFNRGKKVLFQPVQRAIRLVGNVKRLFHIRLRTGLLPRIQKFNSLATHRKPLSVSMQAELGEFFIEDIHLLERITGRSLVHWYNK